VLKKPGGRKKQVQARGKTPRSQSLFFTAFALLAQLIGFFNSPTGPGFASKCSEFCGRKKLGQARGGFGDSMLNYASFSLLGLYPLM